MERNIDPVNPEEKSLNEPIVKKIFSSVQTIERIPHEGLFVQALTSESFQQRIQAGILRLRQLQAESGFVVMANQNRIVYPPLAFGTAMPDIYGVERHSSHSGQPTIQIYSKMSEAAIAYLGWENAGVNVNQSIPSRMIWSEHPDIKSLSVIGYFHFHPIEAPFSNSDIEHYDEFFEKNFLLLWRFRSDVIYGVFMPQWRWEEGQVSLPKLRLFFFQGPSGNNNYMVQDFKMLSLEAQKRALEDSGFKTSVVDMAVGPNGTVDISPLRTTLQGI